MTEHDALSVGARHERLAGWGTPDANAQHLARRIIAEFERQTGNLVRRPAPYSGRRPAPPPTVPDSRLEAADVDALGRITTARADAEARRAFSLGKSYPDLVAARAPALERACDIVVQPRTHEELERSLVWLAEQDLAIVPVGGGTSVVGGIEPIGARADQPVAALDMTRLSTCLDVDGMSGVATFQAGIRGPQLETVLAAYGLTLGHVPQSFELSTLGGWLATRSAGQQSLAFGKIERMTAAMRLVTPDGTIDVDHVPAHGAGPGTLELLLGSEGTLGVISQATMRVVQRPPHVRFASYVAPSFEDAADAARTLVQRGLRPGMVRVSDSRETTFTVASSLPSAVPRGLAARAARVAGLSDGALILVVIPGEHDAATALELEVDRHMSRCGARAVGPMPAKKWFHARFEQPYARDVMMDAGLLIDTLETAVTWSRLHELHGAVRDALEQSLGGPRRCVVGCHLSHLYPDGASAYFTFMALPAPGDELATWRRAKQAANDAIARSGGAVSHQHGIGTMHAALYGTVTPDRVVAAWRGARAALDPGGRFNPGKVFELPPPGVAALNAPDPRPAVRQPR